MASLDWIYCLKPKVQDFLIRLKSHTNPGFFHYSYSGDLYDEKFFWGLGNTTFAIKIYSLLGVLTALNKQDKTDMAAFINKFKKNNEFIYDPLIEKRAFFTDKLVAVKNLDFNNFFHKQTKIAETRQALSSLKLLGETLNLSLGCYPSTKLDIKKYLGRLNWQQPWNAGSHFSHLLFFLQESALPDKSQLIDYAIALINGMQHEKDGAWYRGNPILRQKINGAMKIITGLKAVNKVQFNYAKQLIDLCLASAQNEHACDNFNIIYVLKYASEINNSIYQLDKIKKIAEERLAIYKRYYHHKLGGFSFYQNRANTHYYGVKITEGLNEPDIHGTVMFLWGISIIAQILGINDKLQFKEFTA